jgi:hypothetical protein
VSWNLEHNKISTQNPVKAGKKLKTTVLSNHANLEKPRAKLKTQCLNQSKKQIMQQQIKQRDTTHRTQHGTTRLNMSGARSVLLNNINSPSPTITFKQRNQVLTDC